MAAGLSFSFLIVFKKLPWAEGFYFNFATYLAESHVKHHIITRGFLETVNGEWKSTKNVDFLISI